MFTRHVCGSGLVVGACSLMKNTLKDLLRLRSGPRGAAFPGMWLLAMRARRRRQPTAPAQLSRCTPACMRLFAGMIPLPWAQMCMLTGNEDRSGAAVAAGGAPCK